MTEEVDRSGVISICRCGFRLTWRHQMCAMDEGGRAWKLVIRKSEGWRVVKDASELAHSSQGSNGPNSLPMGVAV
jgi:hypothetical protein